MRSPARSLAALAVAVAVGVVGCSDSPVLGGSCWSDQDCASGFCSPTANQCLPVSHKAPGLEVWPPTQNNQGWVVQEFPEGTLQPNGELLVKLGSSVSFEGHVYASDSEVGGVKKMIPARIVVWRESQLPGRPAVQFETTVTASQREGQNNSKSTFVLWLNKGATYAAYVVPIEPFDALYPPLVVTGIKVDDHRKQDFVLDGKDRAVEVVGSVLDATGNPLYRDKPVPVRVRAYRPGGLGQSTLATTDAKGAFSFKVPAGVASYTVRVESAPGEEPVPTLECVGRVLGLLGTDQKQAINQLQLPPFRFAEPYQVSVMGSDQKPIAQATVTFTATGIPISLTTGYKECSASFTQSGITDSAGKVTLRLLPGDAKNRTYSVTVVSPASSAFASQWRSTVEVGPKGGALQHFTLEPRYLLQGRVEMEGQQPVPGAVIEAQAIGSGEVQSVLPPSKASASTDAGGVFELYVDPGIYNIDIRPPPDFALPSFGLTAKTIQGNQDGVLFVVPQAKALRGRILDPTGRELGNAQIKVYDLVPELEKPLIQKAVLRGSAITNSSGSFSLLLPPSLTD